ncbi:MDIS1-interacting receptor like kinase [Trifolium repens]|nr:MDIS1-interacting receptor like kinase [Trifolium repens]
MPQLEVSELWNNLSRSLPSNLGKKSPLQWSDLDESSNSLSGVIPETICSQGNNTKLILFNNAFSWLSLLSLISLISKETNSILLSLPPSFRFQTFKFSLDPTDDNLEGKIPRLSFTYCT